MSSFVYAPLYELLSIYDCDMLVRLDAKEFVTEERLDGEMVNLLVCKNRWGYYLCSNVWINIAQDLSSERLGNLLRASIRRVGLVSAIRLCAQAGDRLVTHAHTANRLKMDDPISMEVDSELPPVLQELFYRINNLPHKVARQILLFPKRFAPWAPRDASILHQKQIDSFVELNRSNVAIERKINSLMARVVTPPSMSLMDRDQDVSPDMLGIAKIARTFCHLLVGDFCGFSKQQFPRVGPGACRNAGRSLFERLEKIAEYGGYELSHVPSWHYYNGFYFLPHPDCRERYYYQSDKKGKRHRIVRGKRLPRGFWGKSPYPQVCRVASVPKSWKAVRLIAIEDVCNMSRQLFMKDELMKAFERSPFSMLLPLRDQEQNRDLARQAAESNLVSTLDLSHASDSVTKPLVRLLYPDTWYQGFEGCVPFGFILNESDERPRPLHMFATMGCGCTFPVEASIFVSLVVATICYRMGISPDVSAKRLREVLRTKLAYLLDIVRVMGDDIEIPTEFEEPVIAALTYFGFEVNRDKSFSRGRFRESCGADYLRCDDGTHCVTVQYWPRIPIGTDGLEELLRTAYSEYDKASCERYTTNGLMRITALQHSLYGLAPRAAEFLADLVREVFPELSTSFPGDREDLMWSANSQLRYAWEIPSDPEWEPSVIADTVQPTQLVSFATAEDYFRQLFRKGKLRARFGNAAERTFVNHAMEASKRTVYTVPSLTMATAYTGINSGAAEILAYELSLQALSAPADRVLPIVMNDRKERYRSSMRRSALCCFRPARLSSERLFAEGYKLAFIAVYSIE